MSAVELHPPVSQPSAIPDDSVDGGYLCNIAMVILIAKEGESAKARALYRAYVSEYRALDGAGLNHEARELRAFRAAAEGMGWRFVDR